MTVRVNGVPVPPARREDCELSLCEHGAVQVTLGGMTADLSRGSFARLCEALCSAQWRLAAQGAAPCPEWSA